MRIAGITKESIVDGPGIRLVVFAQGCKHGCIGCHNPDTHSLKGGQLIEIEEIVKLAQKNPLLDGVTFSGGEPFLQAKEFTELGKELKKLGLNLIIYTGYTYEEIIESKNGDWYELLKVADILVDGKFEIDKKSLELKFKGSSNQRMIDVKNSINEEKIIEIEL